MPVNQNSFRAVFIVLLCKYSGYMQKIVILCEVCFFLKCKNRRNSFNETANRSSLIRNFSYVIYQMIQINYLQSEFLRLTKSSLNARNMQKYDKY